MRQKLLQIITRFRCIFVFLFGIYNHIQPRNRIRTTRLRIKSGITKIDGLRIRCKGKNNVLYIEDFARIGKCRIDIVGNNNTIRIGSKSILTKVEFWIEDDNNTVTIGNDCGMESCVFVLMEGTSAYVGNGCYIAYGTVIRTGDSHSILDMDGNRTNPSQDVTIGDHVWLATDVTVLKGTHIADNCIVAANSTLGKHYEEPNCIIGGMPAKVLKQNINWCGERI